MNTMDGFLARRRQSSDTRTMYTLWLIIYLYTLYYVYIIYYVSRDYQMKAHNIIRYGV